MATPGSIYDPRYRVVYAWWFGGLILVGALAFIPSYLLWEKSAAILARNNALIPPEDLSAARDHVAIAWNSILSRRYAFWAQTLGALFGPLGFTCMFIGQRIALRINEKPCPWLLWVWVVMAFVFAGAGTGVGARWASDSLRDEIDVAKAREYTGHANRAEVSALHDRQSSVSRPWRIASWVCIGGIFVCVGGLAVEVCYARRRERARDGTAASSP